MLEQRPIEWARQQAWEGGSSRAETVLTPFVRNALQRFGALSIAEQILSGTPLTLADAEHLAQHAPLPVLGKLVQLLPARFEHFTVRLRPVFHLPIAAVLEQGGEEGAALFATQRLQALESDLQLNTPIVIAIDRWSGKFRTEQLLGTLQHLAQRAPSNLRFTILGPSTVDLSVVLEQAQADERGDLGLLDDTLAGLRRISVHSLEGGSDLDMHQRACAQDMRVTISQELSVDYPDERDGRFRTRSREEIGRTDLSREFLQELFLIRRHILPSGLLTCWFPWTPTLLDETRGNALPLAVQVLRAMAIGRLVLPEVPYIRAPLSALGLKVAQVGLEYGANDLGFAAVDAETEAALGVARLSEAVQIIEGHNPRVKFVES